MADKFLRHGETFCGDGTASNAAASAGAVGAWNDINVFEGTAPASGALADGDVVYIRSKFNPRSTERNNTSRIQFCTVGMHTLSEKHTRRAV